MGHTCTMDVQGAILLRRRQGIDVVFRGSPTPPSDPTSYPPRHSYISIAKLDNDKQLVFGWASTVNRPDGTPVVDHELDIIDSPSMEDAVYRYVAAGGPQGDMHERVDVGHLVESCYFTPEKYAAMEQPVGKTGWWVGFRVTELDVWSDIKEGKRTEFSIGGTGHNENDHEAGDRRY